MGGGGDEEDEEQFVPPQVLKMQEGVQDTKVILAQLKVVELE